MSAKWHKEELNTLYEMAEAYKVKQIAFRLKRRGYYRTEMAIALFGQGAIALLAYTYRPKYSERFMRGKIGCKYCYIYFLVIVF